jgi:multiple sugar transport system permease protein
MKDKHQEMLCGYVFIAPVILGFLIFMLIPILHALINSFTSASLLRETEFVGLNNYIKLLTTDKNFGLTIKNTVVFSIGLVPLNLILAIAMASLLYEKIPGMSFFRTAFFTPVMVSVVAWSIIWKFILGTEAGLINLLLRSFGIKGPAWLFDKNLAMLVVIVVTVLKGVGMNMVIFLAALHGIPETYYEAALLDGVTRSRRFLYITLPLLAPTVFMLLIITLIGAFKAFGQIYTLTGGGPANATKVIAYYIWEQAFMQYEFGYASAVAFVLFIILITLTLVQWGVRRRWVYNEV